MLFLLPRRCILCQDQSQRPLDLCLACEKDLPQLTHACHQCALPLPEASLSRCGRCMNAPPFFDKTIALYHYKAPINHLITQIKFQGNLAYAELLGSLFAALLKKHYDNNSCPEVIIPIPLHKKRLQQRGFNQAIELARPLQKKMGLAIDYKTCQRIRHTQEQSSLSGKERTQNIKNAFSSKSVHYKHIALLDDVMTTGHTANELSRLLKQKGVKNIDVWTIARTIT